MDSRWKNREKGEGIWRWDYYQCFIIPGNILVFTSLYLSFFFLKSFLPWTYRVGVGRVMQGCKLTRLQPISALELHQTAEQRQLGCELEKSPALDPEYRLADWPKAPESWTSWLTQQLIGHAYVVSSAPSARWYYDSYQQLNGTVSGGLAGKRPI